MRFAFLCAMCLNVYLYTHGCAGRLQSMCIPSPNRVGSKEAGTTILSNKRPVAYIGWIPEFQNSIRQIWQDKKTWLVFNYKLLCTWHCPDGAWQVFDQALSPSWNNLAEGQNTVSKYADLTLAMIRSSQVRVTCPEKQEKIDLKPETLVVLSHV